MPYSPDDVSNLPKNVQEMSDHDKRMWCDIFNSTLEKYKDEQRAFSTANGVLKKRGGQPTEKGYSKDELALAAIEEGFDYDASDLGSIERFISQQVGLPVEIASEIINEEALGSWLE